MPAVNGLGLIPPQRITALASASQTATAASSAFKNEGYLGARIIWNVTSLTSGASLTLYFQGLTQSGTWYNIFNTAAVTATTSTPNVYHIAPGMTESSNVIVNSYVPNTFRVQVVPADSKAVTYSVDVELLIPG